MWCGRAERARRYLSSLDLSPLISVQVDEYDRTFRFWQERLTDDRTLHFGPVDARLSDLMWDGWTLEASGFLHDRFATVRLEHRKRADRYKLFKLNLNSSIGDPPTDLIGLIRDGRQMIKMASLTPERDPFETLKRRFPIIPQRKTAMIGNMTVAEFLTQETPQ